MIKAEELYNFLTEKDIAYYTGVPDSQLKPFCDYITKRLGIDKKHIIAANEGSAVALAAGYHLATGRIGMVYMQNSGLGNALNPITSLAHPEVYGIPIVYMIGWRGQPGVMDEPQHIKQGKITLELLELLDIPFQIIRQETTMDDIKKCYEEVLEKELKKNRSVAFVVGKNAFDKPGSSQKTAYGYQYELSREDAIKVIVDHMETEDVIVSTTGKTSRELFEYRDDKGQGHEKDFLTVGSMGHASMIADSIAENSDKRVWCIDGDGAMLMHTGAAALIGSRKPNNLYHILINNGVHETVGGMPTISFSLDWGKVAEAFGYSGYYRVSDARTLEQVMDKVKLQRGPVFLEVLVNSYSRDNIGRPTIKPIDNKKDIMEFIRKN